jgi:hypothetical protein
MSLHTRWVIALALLLLVPGQAAQGGAPVDSDGDRLSDAFETKVLGTSAHSPDSDQDGIRDGIEDPDRDGLSNAGEQLYATDPHDADTDDDGVSDWDEDADGDGDRDGRRQDARPIPAKLVPTLANSAGDRPRIYARGCHAKPRGVTVKSCAFSYGPPAGRKTVVLTGDSHAAHWFPALDRVARHRGWRLITMTKSSCPVADVIPIGQDGIAAKDCARWRKAVRAKIHDIQPDMVIASTSDIYTFVGAPDNRTAESERLWRRGLTRSLRSFRADAPRVVMLGDVYRWGHAAFGCMKGHQDDLSRCAKGRDSTLGLFGQGRDKTARRAAIDAHASFRPTRQIVCTYDPCPFVVDRFLITYDGSHLTATYSAKIWRAMDLLIPAT